MKPSVLVTKRIFPEAIDYLKEHCEVDYEENDDGLPSDQLLPRLRGKQAILDYWTHVTQTEEDIQFGYEILSATPEQGIARWWASFVIVPPGLQTKLDGIFLISLDENGRCHSFREWWHKLQD